MVLTTKQQFHNFAAFAFTVVGYPCRLLVLTTKFSQPYRYCVIPTGEELGEIPWLEMKVMIHDLNLTYDFKSYAPFSRLAWCTAEPVLQLLKLLKAVGL